MSRSSIDAVFSDLDVRLNAFSMCEIGDGCALEVAPHDEIVLHYILRGMGAIDWKHGSIPITAGMVVLIPKKLPKLIRGSGHVITLLDPAKTCQIVSGSMTYKAPPIKPGLLLCCAAVDANLVGGAGLFDHLQQPLAEHLQDKMLALLFELVLKELPRHDIGTRAIVEAMLKQILVLLMRDHLKRSDDTSPFYLPLMSPQLGRALTAMLGAPQDPHSVDSLAELAEMSRSRFAHHFVTTFGRSPIQYLQSIRLQAAARLLRDPKTSIQSVAAAVGFASRSHFSRAFKRKYGRDPSSFKSAS